jgi:chromosome segregation ATPase
MTEAQSRSISENDYHHYRERQDEDLRREFVILHTRIEEGNENLRAELVQEFNNNLSTTEGTLSGKLGLLANELDNVKVDLRSLKNEVGEVKNEVGEVKNEVGEVKNEVGEVNARLNQMEGRSYNKSRFLPSQAIESIGIFEPGIGFRKPTYFPRKIKDFWNLYHPDNGM